MVQLILIFVNIQFANHKKTLSLKSFFLHILTAHLQATLQPTTVPSLHSVSALMHMMPFVIHAYSVLCQGLAAAHQYASES